jgi:hypothetical protein
MHTFRVFVELGLLDEKWFWTGTRKTSGVYLSGTGGPEIERGVTRAARRKLNALKCTRVQLFEIVNSIVILCSSRERFWIQIIYLKIWHLKNTNIMRTLSRPQIYTYILHYVRETGQRKYAWDVYLCKTVRKITRTPGIIIFPVEMPLLRPPTVLIDAMRSEPGGKRVL